MKPRTILSAGEIAVYSVCPESWRLKNLEKVKRQKSEAMAKGQTLHEQWASQYDNAVYLARNAKLLVLLVCFTIIIYALLSGH